jgi:hypothetical protein
VGGERTPSRTPGDGQLTTEPVTCMETPFAVGSGRVNPYSVPVSARARAMPVATGRW